MEHTISLDMSMLKEFSIAEGTISALSNETCNSINENPFDAFEHTRSIEKTLDGNIFDLIMGEASRHVQRIKRVQNRVVVQENGEHQCTSSCNLQPVVIKVYDVGGGRVHVCTTQPSSSACVCLAPTWMHKKPITEICHVLHVCESSNAVHVCTEEKCKAHWVKKDTNLMCELTGKVMKVDNEILSMGWIEDNWRPSKRGKASRNKSKCKDMGTMTTDIFTCAKETLTQIIQHKSIVIDTPYEKLDEPSRCIRSNLTGALRRIAAGVITHMLPGSEMQKVTEKRRRVNALLKFYSLLEKYIRTQKQLYMKSQLPPVFCLSAMDDIAKSVTRNTYLSMTSITLDPQKMITAAHGYSHPITKLYLTLLKHTRLIESDIKFTDFVVAALYLQSQRFKVKGVYIFTNDTFLQCFLPPANTLNTYPIIKKGVFTTTKTVIQKRIVEAIDAGVNPSTLAFPLSTLAELFT